MCAAAPAALQLLHHPFLLSMHVVTTPCPLPLCLPHPLPPTQSRYSGQVEGVVKALVEDTGRLSRGVRGLEGLYSSQQMSLQDTKEALLR